MNRVLIAAADVSMAESVQANLSSAGFHTAVVWNASQLLDFCKQHEPNVLVIDLELPGGSVWAALQAIRTLPALKNMPIVGLGDPSVEVVHEHAKAAGVMKLLAKASASQVLAAELNTLLIESHNAAPESPATGNSDNPVVQLKTLTDEVIQIAEQLKPQIPAFGPDGPELFGYIENSSSDIIQKLGGIAESELHDKEIRHDFRNMIGSVTGFAELILMEPNLPNEAQSGLSRIRECSRVFVNLLDQQKAVAA